MSKRVPGGDGSHPLKSKSTCSGHYCCFFVNTEYGDGERLSVSQGGPHRA